MDVAVSAVGLLIMAVLFVHELRFYLETVTVHEASMHTFSIALCDQIYFHLPHAILLVLSIPLCDMVCFWWYRCQLM